MESGRRIRNENVGFYPENSPTSEGSGKVKPGAVQGFCWASFGEPGYRTNAGRHENPWLASSKEKKKLSNDRRDKKQSKDKCG